MDITRACRDLNELHPVVKDLAEKLVAECKNQGINMGISETYRSPERQDYLYAQGRTRPGAIITNVKGSSMSSYHQWRLAFDVYNNVRGDEYNATVLNKIGKIGQSLGLEWGGAWSGFRDTPHFQYTFGLSIKDLVNGKKPPMASQDKEVVKEEIKEVDKVYEEAIKLLVDRKIITTAEDWLPGPNVKYVDILISRIVAKLLEQQNYDKQINFLAQEEIIGSPEIWLGKKYSETDVKWLIKKSAKALGE